MDVDVLIDRLAVEGPLLADAAGRAGLDAPVPATEWTVRDLVIHTSGVHRWAADIIATCSQTADTAAGEAVGTGPSDDTVLDWFRAGHSALVETLRAAPADLDCLTFLPAPSPLAFWARRQAHETAMHRADAEAAAGAAPDFDAGFAQDGVAELLLGFAARRSNAIERAATLGLHATDGPDWLVTLGGPKILAEQASADGADAVVAGCSAQLYLWLWNRPSGAVVSGDPEVAALWRGVRVRWG